MDVLMDNGLVGLFCLAGLCKIPIYILFKYRGNNFFDACWRLVFRLLQIFLLVAEVCQDEAEEIEHADVDDVNEANSESPQDVCGHVVPGHPQFVGEPHKEENSEHDVGEEVEEGHPLVGVGVLPVVGHLEEGPAVQEDGVDLGEQGAHDPTQVTATRRSNQERDANSKVVNKHLLSRKRHFQRQH